MFDAQVAKPGAVLAHVGGGRGSAVAGVTGGHRFRGIAGLRRHVHLSAAAVGAALWCRLLGVVIPTTGGSITVVPPCK